MDPKSTAIDKQNGAHTGCCHHWVIDRPLGPTSRGICKVCGAEKRFQNDGFVFRWEDGLAPDDSLALAQMDDVLPGLKEADS